MPATRGCGTECASRKNSSTLTGAVFVLAAQAVDSPQENTFTYGAGVSGATLYNYHRTYSAASGRFTQADPIGMDGGWNRFAYAQNNPFNSSDALGLQSQLGGIVSKKIGDAITSGGAGSVSQILGEACYMSACTADGNVTARTIVQAYGDCAGLLNSVKGSSAAVAGAMQSLPGGVDAVLYGCAKTCSALTYKK